VGRARADGPGAATVPLGRVEGVVGRVEQRLAGRPRVVGDAHAEADGDRPALDVERRLQRADQALRDRNEVVLRRRLADEDGELVAA